MYVSQAKLANIATGQAEVRWFTPYAPNVAWGNSRSLGWVIRSASGNWVAQDADRVPVKAFASRKAAINFLVAAFKKEQSA